MHKITKEELISLAHLSRLQLTEHEVNELLGQIDEVLHYALRVKDLAQKSGQLESNPLQNYNVFREDVVIKTDPKPILAQAPETDQNYFVVPVILDTP